MENLHIAGRFDKDLGNIKNRVLKMGVLVTSQLEMAMATLTDLDTVDVDALIKKDRKVNGMNKSIAGRAERLIALRQPMALDLRQALSPINIASELERVGDHAKYVAKRAQKITGKTVPDAFQIILSEMSEIVLDQIRDVLRAYEHSDIELAAHVRDRDLRVDELNDKIFSYSIDALSDTGEDAETMMNVVLISRSFERVGDHIVNIARYVNQIVTGDDLKATS